MPKVKKTGIPGQTIFTATCMDQWNTPWLHGIFEGPEFNSDEVHQRREFPLDYLCKI